jgi:hypothetical protein
MPGGEGRFPDHALQPARSRSDPAPSPRSRPWSRSFPQTLDGEIVQIGERGIDFYAITGKQTRNISLMAFDTLSLDGKDLRSLPLQERLAQLESLLLRGQIVQHLPSPTFDDGQALMNACMEHTLEGVDSKRRASTYTAGRGRHCMLEPRMRKGAGPGNRRPLSGPPG